MCFTALQAAYVRQRVLQTWAKLVEESCMPLNHWNILLAQGKQRLSAARRSTRRTTQCQSTVSGHTYHMQVVHVT